MFVFAWSLDLQLPVQSVPITTKVVSLTNPTNDEVYSIQHYVIKFVSDLRQVGGFLRILGFPLPIKLTTKEMMIRDKKREMNWFCSQLPVGYRRCIDWSDRIFHICSIRFVRIFQ